MESSLSHFPVIQVAIDMLTIDEALRIGEAAVRAGADWLEAGTPLITFEGVRAVGELAKAFPGIPILADYKTMDGSRKYVIETKNQGGRIATVCAVASDATIRVAVEAGKESGIAIVSDLYAAPDVPGRAAELEALGVESVYVHWGSDQRVADPSRDPQLDLPAVVDRVRIPVGVGTFSAEEGARAVRQGAKIAVVGFPLIGESDVESALRRYVDAVKSA